MLQAMRWLRFVVAVMLAGAVSAQAQAEEASVPGEAYELTLAPGDHELDRAQFELWVPATVGEASPVRGVITVPLYQADRRIYEREDWRGLAAKHRLAMLRHDMRTTVGDRPNRLPVGMDAVDAIDAALARWAEQLDQPHLAGAPLVLTGLSQGGWQSTRLAALIPQRVIAAVPFHGAGFDEAGYGPDAATQRVPMLVPLGQQDDLTMRVRPALQAMLAHRPQWAGLIQPNVPHHQLGDQAFILMWLDEVLDRRLPESPGQGTALRPLDYEQGWAGSYRLSQRLQPSEVEVRPVAELEPDHPGGHWLPSERLARAWATATLTGHVTGHSEQEEIAATAVPLSHEVAVDGQLDEWPDLPERLRWPAQILPTGLNWHGPEDSHARFALGHDEHALYLAIRVHDDEGLYAGQAPWMSGQDGVEVRLDARPAPQRMANVGEGEGSAFLLLAVGPGPEQAHVVGEQDLPEGVRVAGSQDETGYSVEIAIPHAILDQAQGGRWRRVRLNLAIDDADTDGNSQVWWRPDWRSEQNYFGSGTIERRSAE
ncbi:MAG: sugar-binding protein [Phycisphaeraceae bacterium]